MDEVRLRMDWVLKKFQLVYVMHERICRKSSFDKNEYIFDKGM